MTDFIDTEVLLKDENDDEQNSNNPESFFDSELTESSSISFPAKPMSKNNVPVDKYNFTYLVFYLLGINTLIPWTYFITADDYWKFKFRDDQNHSRLLNINNTKIFLYQASLHESFTSYLCIASSIPNTLFLIINIFMSSRISLNTRMIGSQGIILIIFIVTTSFAKINTDDYQNAFLILTLTSVGIVNAASAIYGGSLFGVVGKFASKYITAMTAGQALSGIFTALIEILSLWIGANPITSGLLYFIIGDIVVSLSLVAYLILQKVIFFKYFIIMKSQHGDESDITVNNGINSRLNISYSTIFKKTWHYNVSVFILFVITMTVYPSITVLIQSEKKGHGHAWNDIYFVPVITYLVFSSADCFGRILSGIFIWPKKKSYFLIILSIMRILFVPTFLVCNVQPRNHLPIYIHDDVCYIILTIFFGLSNGYLCNISFLLTPTVVTSKEKEVASAMLGAFIGIGVSFGSVLSFFMLKIL